MIVLIIVSIVIICIVLPLIFTNETENMINVKKYTMHRIGSGCNCRSREHYASSDDDENYDIVPNRYELPILGPWWNSTRFNKNSSWDIRGDVPINPVYVGPWLASPLIS